MDSESANQLAQRMTAKATVQFEDFSEKICESKKPMMTGCKKSAAMRPLSRNHCFAVIAMVFAKLWGSFVRSKKFLHSRIFVELF